MSRAAQLWLNFPSFYPPTNQVSCLTAGREATTRERQPKKFPPGWFASSLADPDWRAHHYAQWSKRRKALGLPSIVLDREVA